VVEDLVHLGQEGRIGDWRRVEGRPAHDDSRSASATPWTRVVRSTARPLDPGLGPPRVLRLEAEDLVVAGS
jgi:hypothetical protein